MNSSANVMEAAGHAVQSAEEAARTGARAGSREFRNLIADAEDLIRRVAHIGDRDLARARAKLEQTLDAAKVSLHDGSEHVKSTARHAVEGTDEFVHSNPWSAIGLAAAAGAAIAVLLSTRMHR
jgi:ElaB/YqjD/DUF883 family membrane-anchored ribosome-binding protein